MGTAPSSPPPRVKLVLPTGRDKGEYLRVREDSAHWLEPWEPLLPGGRSPIDDEAFDRFHKSSETETSRRFLVKLAGKDTPIVGQISINNIIRGPFLSATLGYWIAKPHAGQGLMSEALRLAVTHAFTDLALHRVEANIIPRNAASIGLVKKLGFRHEGTAERYLRIAGVWEDHERWGMTVERWTA
ncbi:MAG: GNAT family N-acetyltransferase [Tepidisphaera sp.]